MPSAAINGTLTITPAVGNGTLSSLGAFAIAGAPGNWIGHLDIDGNPLVVSGFQIASPLSKTSSPSAVPITPASPAANLPPAFGLAVIDNALTQFTTFHGQTVPFNFFAFILAPELRGDANIDGTVDLSDLSTILNHFGQSTLNWTDGNFDNAPTIDLTDLSDVLNNFGQTNPNASESCPLSAPEPTTLLLLVASFPALARRRSTRRTRLPSVHHRRRSEKPPLVVFAAAASLTFLGLLPARAATDTWNDASGNGNWNTPSNWNTNTVPVANDTVFITGGPTIPVNAPWTVAYDFTGGVTLNSLTISHSDGVILPSANTLNMPGGSLTTVSEFIGDSTSGGSRGMGILSQSGGVDTATTFILGRNPTDSGTYNATTGGGVITTTLTVGSAGRGSFNLSPGFLTLRASGPTSPSLILGDAPGSNGTFSLTANSSIFAPNGTEIIGNNGNGNFTQTGGDNSLNTSNNGFTQIILGNQTNSSGTYNLQAGTVTATNLDVGGAGTGNFTHSGGVVTLLPVSMGGSIFTANFSIATASGTGSYTLGVVPDNFLVVGGYELHRAPPAAASTRSPKPLAALTKSSPPTVSQPSWMSVTASQAPAFTPSTPAPSPFLAAPRTSATMVTAPFYRPAAPIPPAL